MSPGTREASTIARSYCSAVGAQHRDARSVFDAYDTSRSGEITFEDLRRGVRSDPSMSKSGFTDTDVRRRRTPPSTHSHTCPVPGALSPMAVGNTHLLAADQRARAPARQKHADLDVSVCIHSAATPSLQYDGSQPQQQCHSDRVRRLCVWIRFRREAVVDEGPAGSCSEQLCRSRFATQI